MADTWDVVATVKSDHHVIDVFCNHHLKVGVNFIYLFLDDASQKYSHPSKQIKVITASSDECLKYIEERQERNAFIAARSSTSEWILHIDVDEFIDPIRPVSEYLESVPNNINTVNILPIEPVYSHPPLTLDQVMRATHFKKLHTRPAADRFWKNAYRDLFDFTNHGFWAHASGKSFFRTSFTHTIKNLPRHKYYGNNAKLYGRVSPPDILLRHYDFLHYEAWLTKHLDRINSNVAAFAGDKRMQIASMLFEADDAHRLEIYKTMTTLKDRKMARAIDLGLLIERPSLTEL